LLQILVVGWLILLIFTKIEFYGQDAGNW